MVFVKERSAPCHPHTDQSGGTYRMSTTHLLHRESAPRARARQFWQLMAPLSLAACAAVACKETEPPLTPPVEVCKAEDTRSRPCGLNGTGTQIQECTDGKWANQGACSDPDVCVYGKERTRACGPNDSGEMLQYCDTGQWVDDGPCEHADVCTVGDTQPVSCGPNDRGSQIQRCDDGAWVDEGACEDTDVCRDMTVRREPCGGRNGRATQRQVCTQGQWGTLEQCLDPDECTDDDSRQIGCGGRNGNAQQNQVCVAGTWEDSGSCNDPDVCYNNQTRPENCGGLNGNATQNMLCANGQWTVASPCTDPDICVNGAQNTQNCGGFNGNAIATETCVYGQWNLGPCVDPDVCQNADQQLEPCGEDDLGLGTVTCTAGQWSAPNECSLHADAVIASVQHACAVLEDLRVVCWGGNDFGQVGAAAGSDQATPHVVSLPSTIVQVVAGDFHNCALTFDGDVLCWGDNSAGQLADATSPHASTPQLIDGIDGSSDATAALVLFAGSRHTCALTRDGELLCWGDNAEGQLGVPMSLPPHVAVTVPFFDPDSTMIEAVALGATHSCAIVDTGEVWCWGSNADNQLSADLVAPADYVVVHDAAATPLEAMAITAGARHTCVLDADGQPLCWGANTEGQLGDGTQTPTTDVVQALAPIDPNDPYVQLESSDTTTCALTDGGVIVCWGGNDRGQAGQPLSVPVVSTPDVVTTTLPAFSMLGFRASTACGRLDDGRIACWGANDDGLLIAPSITETHLPRLIPYQ